MLQLLLQSFSVLSGSLSKSLQFLETSGNRAYLNILKQVPFTSMDQIDFLLVNTHTKD